MPGRAEVLARVARMREVVGAAFSDAVAAARAAAPGAAWPEAPRWEERAGLVIAASAVMWMFLVSAWGCAGPFPAGHFAATAGIGTAAFNMWKYHIIYPVLFNPVPPSTPPMSVYYMHHPLGIYWVTALLFKVLGAHNAVVRLPAIVYSTAVPFFVYRTGRATWGPLPGALAALAFVSLPITLGFSNFHALEGPVIFGCTVAAWGYARFVQTGRDRYAYASVAGLVFAVNQDWIAYLWGGMLLAWIFARAFVAPPRVLGAVPARPMARYWALLATGSVLSLMVAAALIYGTGRLEDVLGSYGARSSGNGIPLSAILASRHVRIELMFTGAAIFLGKLALPIVVARLVVRRNELEGLALPFLLAAAFQYVHFKQGADVHIFWPQYFAAYFAFAVGALAATALGAVRALAPHVRGRVGDLLRARGAVVGALVVGLPVLFVFQDGARTVRLSRETGGRFVEGHIESDIDKIEALQWFAAAVPPTETIGMHPGIQPVHWGLLWELRPHPLDPNEPIGTKTTHERYEFIDTRYASSGDLKSAAAQFHVTALDHFWFFDRREPPAPLTGLRFDEHEPSLVESFVRGFTEPVRRVVPDPWSTWEWRMLLAQPLAPVGPPPPPATSLEQLRIAHNQALGAGDKVAAAGLRKRVEAALTDRLDVGFDNGTRLLGFVRGRGAERAFTLFFVAGDFHGGRAEFRVRAKVVLPPRFSTLPQDGAELDIAPGPPIPTDAWRPGSLYAVHVPIRKRPGTEELTGAFVSLDGRPAPGLTGRAKTLVLGRL